jgi:hypothetical protein
MMMSPWMTTLSTITHPVLAAGGNRDSLAILVPAMIVLVAGYLAWSFSRSRSLLEQWAADNGFEILEREYRTFRRGPFFWTSSKNQAVYHVKVRDREGNVRSGWVRCGGWFLGLLSDQTEVRWED